MNKFKKLCELILKNTDVLSPTEYEKLSKKKNFNSKEWKWDSNDNIYKRIGK